MAKFKRYNYSQSVLVPVLLEKQLMPGTLEFAIHMLSKQQLTELKADDWTYDGKVNFSDPKFDIEGDKAIVNLKLNVGVAGNRNSHYTMVKENDEWLISNVVIDNY